MFKRLSQSPQHNAGAILEKMRSTQPYNAIFEKVDHSLSMTRQNFLCPKGLCALLGEFGSSSRAISEWARQVGTTLMIIEEQPLPMEWLHRYASHLDFIMVDADYMDDTETTIDFCMQVRRATPWLPLILLSSDVRGHDLTCERMAACDITLKNPVQGQAISCGVEAAYLNNAYYLFDRH